MPKAKNPVWHFFASVKFALTTLSILATTSIIGTLIQQGKEPSYYVQEYGRNLARVFEVLDITNMYSSWWFITLLCLFAVNLVVCSVERLPRVWRLVTLDNLSVDPQQLEKKHFTHRTDSRLSASTAAEDLLRFVAQSGWRNSRRRDRDGTILLFAQKGAWTRLGVYLVHFSILVILVGAIAGTLFGYKAYVFLPEGRSTPNIFLQKNQKSIPLGFELRCDHFERTFYSNGMTKEYRADLTVLDPQHDTTYHKSIIVNDPLSYRGLTFYVSDAYPLQEFYMEIRNRTTGQEQAFRVPPKRDVAWEGTGVSFRIEALKSDQEGVVHEAKIRFSANTATEPSDFVVKDKGTVTIHQSGEEFTVSFRQLYSTLLLVAKDPGVLIVYVGCFLMILGLATVFFLSHQRLWVWIIPETKQQGSQILISGTSNKNKPAFERRFQTLVDRFKKEF